MTVKVYSTTTCPYCVMTKEYLKSKGVKFEDILLEFNPQAAQEMVELTGQMGVPVTLVVKDDGQKSAIIGFDRVGLDKVLGL